MKDFSRNGGSKKNKVTIKEMKFADTFLPKSDVMRYKDFVPLKLREEVSPELIIPWKKSFRRTKKKFKPNATSYAHITSTENLY